MTIDSTVWPFKMALRDCRGGNCADWKPERDPSGHEENSIKTKLVQRSESETVRKRAGLDCCTPGYLQLAAHLHFAACSTPSAVRRLTTLNLEESELGWVPLHGLCNAARAVHRCTARETSRISKSPSVGGNRRVNTGLRVEPCTCSESAPSHLFRDGLRGRGHKLVPRIARLRFPER